MPGGKEGTRYERSTRDQRQSAGGKMTNIHEQEHKAVSLLESVKPDLTRILENAPAYGSCGMEICFHDSKIVRIILKAEVSKLSPPEKTNDR
jgi:hypothetical protein